MLKEFKTFAMRGNVIDLAVGIIIGGAFGKIVSSLVNDIIMPVLGLILGKIDFTSLQFSVKNTSGKVIVAIKYGQFIQSVVDFLVISFVIFLMIKFVNRLNKKQPKEETVKVPSTEEKLLTEIRDLLKENK